jgi:predicted short-subunit dehydrogenase-like oxidoreductase (DUF2520 family)
MSPQKVRKPLRVALVGAGNVCAVLGRVLTEHRHRVVAVVSRRPASARKAARFIGCRTASGDLRAIPPDTDIVYLTTPHSAVEDVARALAREDGFDFAHTAYCHASGMLTAEALAPLAARGATVFSFHPLQTFPRDFTPGKILPTARGIAYGIDGPPKGVKMARRFAAALGGTVLPIPPDHRVLYHAACVVASNYLTTLEWLVERMGKECGLSEKAMRVAVAPIMDATLRNIRSSTPAAALSGPIARGGVETVARHLDAVRQQTPDLLRPFVLLGRETVALAESKNSISGAQRSLLLELLDISLTRPEATS